MSEAKRSEPQVRSDHEAQDDGEELLLDPAGDLVEEADGMAGGEIDAKRGRRRSMTMSRKEIARELRRQRAFGIVDPELEETVREIEASRPRSRADCANGPRPCMFIACKHHLYLDVNPSTGSIKLNFPDREVWELDETCALDVADKGGITLEEVGSIMNLTRERIRQVETRGLAKLRTIAEDEPRSPSCKADDLLD
jgi:hypothetical protein